MTSKGVDDDTLKKALLTSFQENNEDVTDVIIAKSNGTALMSVFVLLPHQEIYLVGKQKICAL